MLTVVMATCNGAQTLPKVLTAYCRLLPPKGGWSLIIVDDGSTDSTPEIIAQFGGRLSVRYVRQERRGKNAALNNALQIALADPDRGLLVFTDDDATPYPDWLTSLAECAEAHQDYAVFGGAIEADWGAPPPDWILKLVPLGLTYAVTTAKEGPIFPGLIWGANMAVRRSVFDAGHRFNAAVGPAAGAYAMGSETEFNRRVAAAGYRSWFCASAKIQHYIRPHQLTAKYVLQRAYRFGRGSRAQEARSDLPHLLNVPRWMLSKLAVEVVGVAKASLTKSADALFLARWEVQYLTGYIYQAWFAKQPTRVLITSCSGELGGMEMRMAQEARLLSSAGIHSAFATPRFSGFDAFADKLRTNQIEVSEFDPPQFAEQWAWRRTNKLRAQLWPAVRMRRYRPNLVHVAFCWTSYGASALWLAHHCKLPTVISVHNAFPKTTFTPWHDRLYAEAFQSVRGIYAVSASAMDHFVANFSAYIVPSTRLHIIPNSVDTDRFFPSEERRRLAREKWGLPADSLVVGSVARLSPQKRTLALVELFSALRQRFPNLYLVLAGTGPLEQEAREKVTALGLQSCVVFTGFVGAVEELIPAFDLHLLLSKNEGFGISTIEAMACGVPVVGTDVPGTADILRESRGGVLVPLDDPGKTLAMVGDLIADPQRRSEMARHARAEMEAGYTPLILQRRVFDFYDGLFV